MRLSEVKLGQVANGLSGGGPVRVIAVTGDRYGSGKTSIAINLSLSLARAGHNTLLMDADPGIRNVEMKLGLIVENTIADVLDGRCSLDDILVPVNDNLKLVPAASGIRHLANSGSAECAGLMRAFSDLRNPVDTLVIDTASGTSGCVARLCRAATEVLVVTGNHPASLGDCADQLRVLHNDHGIVNFKVITNRVNTASEGNLLFRALLVQLQDDEGIICSFAGYIPEDEYLDKAGIRKEAVVEAFPRSRSAMALKHLAARVSDWPRSGQPGGHLEFFVERLIYNENVDREVAS